MARRFCVAWLLAAVVGCSQSARLPPLLVQGEAVTAIDEQGAEVQLLPSDPDTMVSQLIWAPDSTFAVWTEVDTAAGTARIAMGNAESQRRIDASTIPFFYGFSPDGKTLAYLGNDPAGGGVALGLVDVAAGSVRLVDAGQPYYFDWSPDSSRLLIHANQSDTYLLTIEGEKEPIDVAPGVYQAPAFLDNGRVLVVENASLASIDPATSDREVIAEIETFSQFTATGDRVAFTANSEYAPGPLSVVADGQQTRLTEDPVIAFEWSPNGDLLYYLALTPEGLGPAIWDGENSVTFPAVLPSTVFLQSYLPFWDQYSRFHTLWRSDSTGFYLPRDGSEIAFYPVDGSEVSVVAEGSMAFPAPP